MTLVIDCHGHFTTEPKQHHEFRAAQLAYAANDGTRPVYPGIGDDELRSMIEGNQL